MKKRSTKLILLLLVMILLIGAFVLLKVLNKEDEMIVDENPASFTLMEIDSDTVKKIQYTKDDKTIGFTKKSGSFVYDEDNDFPLTQNYVTTIVEGFKTISYTRILEDHEELSSYGLDNPETVVDIEANGETYNFKIGDYNSFSSEYYMLYDGKIYMTDSNFPGLFDKALFDYLTTTDKPEIEKIKSVKIDDKEYKDEDDLPTLLDAYNGLSVGNVADYKDKENYGFDGTQRKVVVTYSIDTDVTDTDGNVTNTVSNDATFSFEYSIVDDKVYCMLQDDDLIYNITGTDAFETFILSK